MPNTGRDREKNFSNDEKPSMLLVENNAAGNRRGGTMQDLLSVGEMRMSDAIAISSFVPGMELMRRAGEGIFRAAEWKPPVAVVCGTGNNAGDGYVTAMMLQEAGIPCEILLQEEKFTPDGKFWFDCCAAKKIPVRMWKAILLNLTLKARLRLTGMLKKSKLRINLQKCARARNSVLSRPRCTGPPSHLHRSGT